MTYAEATQFLYGLRRFGWRPGLETVRHLLALLGDPQESFPSIHIGGTNGKGSTAAMVQAILCAAGCRTGLYTSPHLLSFTERIRVDGEAIGEEAIVGLTARLQALCAEHFAPETVRPPAGRLPHPTFFELTTAMAFLHFRRQQVDAAVIEVGLGGRLDATNVIVPKVVAITNIALEHQEYLGQTIAEIAGEKAGIVKPGVPILTAAQGEALPVIRRAAEAHGAPLIVVPEAYAWRLRESGLDGQTFDLTGPAGGYERLRIPLAGMHQLENAATAVAVAETLASQGLRLGVEAIRRGLETISWPGRLQVVSRRPRILLDGAHNPAGMEVLATFLREHRSSLGRLCVVFGVLKDKDWQAMLGRLLPLLDSLILTRPASDRAADPREVAAVAEGCADVRIIPDPAEALAAARDAAQAGDTILVTGSLYTVAAALQFLRETA